MKQLLLLEDNAERIAGFRTAVSELGEGWQLRLWQNAPAMIAECEAYFEDVAFISLDHDLNPQPGDTGDPGTGLEVAKFLAGHLPLAPVVIHSSNTDRAWSMHNELRFAGWEVDRVGPIGDDWISKFWLPKVRAMFGAHVSPGFIKKPPDHTERMKRVELSLIGLAIGDAVGEMLAYRHVAARQIISEGLSAGPWFHTDDTEMALSIADVLKIYGHVHQDALARRFAWRFNRDSERGYGKMTRIQMREILAGADWRRTAASAFGGQGSMGNGGAMRAAPLGAFWVDDLKTLVEEAGKSSLVTHTHPEGVAGTIAVAVAAAAAWRLRGAPKEERARSLFNEVLSHTPESQVRRGILLAAGISPSLPLEAVAKTLGCGFLVTAPDTVPFAIWCAAHHLDDYVEAITCTISAGGDCDTNAAIVGGIVALATGLDGIPRDWRTAKE